MKGVMRGSVVRIPVDESGRRRGFLFIEPVGGGEDVFGHVSGFQQTSQKSFNEVVEGDKVEFTVIAGPKGDRAIEIRTL